MTRKRIRDTTGTTVTSGGGGGVIPNVAIGPDYGEGSGSDGKTVDINVAATMDAISIEASVPITISSDGDLSINIDSIPVTTTPTMTDVALSGEVPVGATPTLAAVAMDSAPVPISMAITGTWDKTQTFTANDSWVAPSGVTSVIVRAIGGGGGGASNGGSVLNGGGGGGQGLGVVGAQQAGARGEVRLTWTEAIA